MAEVVRTAEVAMERVEGVMAMVVAVATAMAATETVPAAMVPVAMEMAEAVMAMETVVVEMAAGAVAAEVEARVTVVGARAAVVVAMVVEEVATSRQAPYSTGHLRSRPPPRSTSERTSWPRSTNPLCCSSSTDSQSLRTPLRFRPYIR